MHNDYDQYRAEMLELANQCKGELTSYTIGYARPGLRWRIVRFLRLPLRAWVSAIYTNRYTGNVVPSGETMIVTGVKQWGLEVRRHCPERPLLTLEQEAVSHVICYVRR